MEQYRDVLLSTWLHWAAGLFEGEGSVNMITRSVRVSLGSVDRDVVERFAAVVLCGQVTSTHHKRMRKPMWVWSVSGVEQAERLFELFRPWLGDRRRAQFEAVIARGARKQPRRWRQHVPIWELEEIAQRQMSLPL